ncbi:MAG: DegV family protein [Firmicutes bacterium]|nr:DegV family protein [Bacillota bacterium]NLL87863.1 DegV family protein [Bacillota bacterium]HKM18145.1 DegV family protein [Limnochordia bacterium]
MIKITSDSTCDLSPELLSSLDITLLPLHIVVDGDDYRDSVDITPEDIVNFVEKEKKRCQTTAVNTFEYQEFFSQFAPNYEAVIHFNIGSQFSSCHQNAKLAAADFDNVYVVNSQNLSTGQGHVVLEAAYMAKEGISAQEIVEKLDMLIPCVDASFVIDKLDYLHKGGRCSGLEAFGARLLQIKPCIEVIDGKMVVGKKYRGSLERSLEQYVKDRLVEKDNIDYSRIFITHCMCSEQMVEKVRDAVNAYANFEEILITTAGCTITTHCGPNTLGILCKRTEKKQL